MHSMSNNILFVFEGERTEGIITKSLEKNILNDSSFIKCAFDAEIYQLYRELNDDDFLDPFTLIKNRNAYNKKLLKDYSRIDFAEIYLFFDYDGHATHADDDKLKKLIAFFDEETDKGKLYISYPMVESVRHISDYNGFKDSTVKCKGKNCPYQDICEEKEACFEEPHYKFKVAKESIPQLSNINKYDGKVWKRIIEVHLKKMNHIVNDSFSLPKSIISQITIFSIQLEKHINKKCPEVAVLSSFPIFLHDYFGNKKILDFIENKGNLHISTPTIIANQLLKLSENELREPFEIIDI